MSKVIVELNPEGVRELLSSDEMYDECEKYAKNAQATLGEGYEVTTYTGINRVNAEVAATTYKARKDNAENNSILKAIMQAGKKND